MGELRREFEALLAEVNRSLGKVEEVEGPARIRILEEHISDKK